MGSNQKIKDNFKKNHKHKHMKYIISILIISLLASCKTGKNALANEKNTIYKKWELNTLNGQTIHEEIPIYLDLKEEDHAVNGFIGCNSVNGSFTIEEKEIRFTQLATTRKACMDKIGRAHV